MSPIYFFSDHSFHLGRIDYMGFDKLAYVHIGTNVVFVSMTRSEYNDLRKTWKTYQEWKATPASERKK